MEHAEESLCSCGLQNCRDVSSWSVAYSALPRPGHVGKSTTELYSTRTAWHGFQNFHVLKTERLQRFGWQDDTVEQWITGENEVLPSGVASFEVFDTLLDISWPA